MVVSFMEFNTLWKEDVVIQTIENAFKNVLDESQSHPRFEFLQVCGSKLLKPNVPFSHSWTGEKIQKLARQGDIYIRPTYEVSVTDSEVSSATETNTLLVI
jgi:hypothetical protein